ncbi:extracellular solute-binding protein [Paenibacillus mesophilus]|uniref:ABC transporter substrate-binding protein n=1 Tax=Paenibacillus mesophilus TaxID=2582849 RepID=UPI00110D5AB2|nr:extracellular solute-binding protein [Paenibacillus mesophilus]TMV48610.1 extracellular solute-binding protein [Paenibacillus mesophilus]
MKFIQKAGIAIGLFGSLGAMLAGCGNGGSADTKLPAPGASPTADKPPVKDTSPAKLTLYVMGGLTEDYAKQYIVSHVQKQMPYITLNIIVEGKGATPSELVTAGNIPDLMFFPNNRLHEMNDLGLLTNLDPLVKSHNMDLNRLDDGLVDSIRKYSDKGELLTMPWGTSNYALYYNKDIFDKFAVPYPKDGMTWDDVYQLAGRLTRNDGGVQYKGFDFAPSIYLGYNPLSASLVDSKTGKAAFQTDAWKKMFETFGKFIKIPGNDTAGAGKELDDFTKTRTLAMRAGTTMLPQLLALEKEGKPLNFDLVSFPSFPETPKTSLQYLASTFAISSQSKSKNQAMDIIQIMLSDEVQKEGAGILRLTALKSQDVRNSTGKDYPSIAGKNIKALYANKIAPTKDATKYDEIARKALPEYFKSYVQGTKDLNTALRELEEDVNKKIAQEKAK